MIAQYQINLFRRINTFMKCTREYSVSSRSYRQKLRSTISQFPSRIQNGVSKRQFGKTKDFQNTDEQIIRKQEKDVCFGSTL